MSAAPHILFINEFFHPDICASAVVASQHVQRIAALRPDWRLTVLTGNRAWHDSSQIYAPQGDYHGVRIMRVNRPPMGERSLLLRGIGFAIFQRNVVRAAQKLGPADLVVGTTAPPQGGQIARTISRLHSCPFVYKVLDLYPDLVATLGRLRPGSFVYRRWLARDIRAMREAVAVVTISTRITERIVQTRSLDAAKVVTIHDGDDDQRLRCHGPSVKPPNRFVVQYAGNMGLSHPFGTILDAANRLKDDPSILFQFIGEGPGRAMLETKLPENAELLGYQPPDRLGQVLAGADLCMITQHELMFDQAMPYKIYSILAAGKPVIFVGSARSEIVDWIRSYEIGNTIEQGNGTGLAAVIAELKHDPARLLECGRRSRQLFFGRFQSDSAAAAWVELLDRALSARLPA